MEKEITYKQNNYNAYYSSFTRILMIKENKIFRLSLDKENKYLISGKDITGKYTISILILLMHELFGHVNHAYRVKTKIGRKHSPTNITIKTNGNLIKYITEYSGESVSVVEFCISQFEEVILYLKFSGDDYLNY